MKVYPVSIARIQLTDILSELIGSGEEVLITVHGDPVGKLVLPTAKDKQRYKNAIQDDSHPADVLK